jgi:hypothetical protein
VNAATAGEWHGGFALTLGNAFTISDASPALFRRRRRILHFFDRFVEL